MSCSRLRLSLEFDFTPRRGSGASDPGEQHPGERGGYEPHMLVHCLPVATPMPLFHAMELFYARTSEPCRIELPVTAIIAPCCYAAIEYCCHFQLFRLLREHAPRVVLIQTLPGASYADALLLRYVAMPLHAHDERRVYQR